MRGSLSLPNPPLLFFFNIYLLFIYLFWPRRVSDAARGIFVAACGLLVAACGS